MMIAYIPLIALAAGWTWLWTKTYRPCGIGRYLLHTLVFLLLSLVIAWLSALIVFSPVDDSYSASNIGALGLMLIPWYAVFGTGCLCGIMATLGELIEARAAERERHEEENKDQG